MRVLQAKGEQLLKAAVFVPALIFPLHFLNKKIKQATFFVSFIYYATIQKKKKKKTMIPEKVS